MVNKPREHIPIDNFQQFHYDWIDRALAIFTPTEAANAFLDMFPEFSEVEGMTSAQIKKSIVHRFRNAKHDPGRASHGRIIEKRKEIISWLQQNEDLFAVWNPIIALKELEQMRKNPELKVSERIKIIQVGQQLHDKLLGTPVMGKPSVENKEAPWQNEGGTGLTSFNKSSEESDVQTESGNTDEGTT